MAQKTALSTTATPGPAHTFTAKTAIALTEGLVEAEITAAAPYATFTVNVPHAEFTVAVPYATFESET